MTNEELLADLKHFIEATVSQQMAQFATKDDLVQLGQRLDHIEQQMATKDDVKALDHKLDEIQDAIADTLTHAADVTNESISGVEQALEDHEKRLTQLEHRAA